MKLTSFTGGLAGLVGAYLATGNLRAADGVDYDRDWNPYVTLRGGWLFGKCKQDRTITTFNRTWNHKPDFKSMWSGSGELGVSCCEDRVFVGVELGYLPGKAKRVSPTGLGTVVVGAQNITFKDFGECAEVENFFGACNATLKKDLGDRTFLYGGVGVGGARSILHGECSISGHNNTTNQDFNHVSPYSKAEWRFLTQLFAGVGVYLNEQWSLSVGYRLRYMPEKFSVSGKFAGQFEWNGKVQQNVIHAAEVGLTYSF